MGAQPIYSDCLPAAGGVSDCLGAVTVGNFSCRLDLDDMVSQVEFVSAPFSTYRYSAAAVQRINCTTPGQISGITANGSAVAAVVRYVRLVHCNTGGVGGGGMCAGGRTGGGGVLLVLHVLHVPIMQSGCASEIQHMLQVLSTVF